MSLNRYSKKRDANERPIIQGLRDAGFLVFALDRPCDLAIYRKPRFKGGRGEWTLMEVKQEGSKPKGAQKAFIDATNTPVVTNLGQALEALV